MGPGSKANVAKHEIFIAAQPVGPSSKFRKKLSQLLEIRRPKTRHGVPPDRRLI
jgi:hypothetical protein